MKRLAEKHTYPQLAKRLVRANWTAFLRSAFYITIKGSDPPSSMTHLFKCFPQIEAIILPVLVLPVNDSP